MGRWEDRRWAGGDGTRRMRRSGEYRAYVPDPLHARSIALTTDNRRLLGLAEAAARSLADGSTRHGLELLGPLLVSSEAAASSWIEGVTPGARQIALAGLALSEDVRGLSESARLVAKNVAVLRESMLVLRDEPRITDEHLSGLQRRLLPDRDALHGIRVTQNWIGGSSFDPLDAAYVPPPPEDVPRLMADLLDFLNDNSLSPLVQAGIAHAQFETIHPFGDGNGRVGRALIHLVLARRGLARGALIPVSLVLMTRTDEYIAGLEAFRFTGDSTDPSSSDALNSWLAVFLRAIIDAVEQAKSLAFDVAEIRQRWAEELRDYRVDSGMSPSPRSDSGVRAVLDGLIEAPIMSVETAERMFGLSERTAARAFAELRNAGIVSTKRDRGRMLIVAEDILELLDLAARRLASPAFNTRESPPARPAPVLPRGHSQPGADHPSEPVFSDAALSVWAKTDAETGEWMRLTRHLLDAAETAGQLWDRWLPANVRRIIADSLPQGDQDGRALMTFLAGIHDIGKASPGFAVKAKMAPGFGHLVDRMADHGLICPPYQVGGFTKLPPHCRIGQHIARDWLVEQHGFSRPRALALTVPIGMHHGVPPTGFELNDLDKDPLWVRGRVDAWREVQQELLAGMARHTGADARLQSWASRPITLTTQALVSAVVVIADWLASDARRFPYADVLTSARRAERARLGRDLLLPWHPDNPSVDVDLLLPQRFPLLSGKPRQLQRELVRVASEVSQPSLLILEAPMGSGKTEAALMASEVLAARFGLGGVFVALPTMATSDAMFDRLLDWVDNLDGDEASTVFLAHGKARLNERYRGLITGQHINAVNAGETEFGELDDEGESAVVSTWLTGRRKGVLATIVAGTIDQVLFGALKTRFLALRHLALAGKVVIIDEVHAADDYMRRYLGGILQWLGAYGTPVVLLSATLPPEQRAYFLQAYAAGSGRRPLTTPAAGYPQITVQGSSTEVLAVPWDGQRRKVSIVAMSEAELADLVVPMVEAGAVVTVIRNTVGSAQSTFSQLRELVGDRVVLLHSRFLADARAARERELRTMLGPPGPATPRPQGFVVVGTQVLEQSLDIDADVMVSDLAPADLILQRAGRLHRHERGPGECDRPEVCRLPRLFLLGVPDLTSATPDLQQGSRAVYGASRLLRAASVLAPHLGGLPITLPDDIPILVDRAYDEVLAPPGPWTRVWSEAEQGRVLQAQDQKARAGVFLLDEPRGESLVGWLAGRTDDFGGDEAVGGAARVRDSEDGIEVIVIYRSKDSIRLLPFSGSHPDADLGVVSLGPPREELALAACAATVRLPGAMTGPGQIDRTIRALEDQCRDFTGWQQSHWLARQLVLCLDENFRADIAGWQLRYDPDLGLEITKEEEMR